MLARAEQHRTDCDMHFVDQPGAQVLADGLRAATEAHVARTCSLPGSFESLLDAPGDELKGGPALHLERLSRVMGQHENWHVVGRVVAPPAAPRLIRPFAAD